MTMWYAVQESRQDAWDYGSHDYMQAVRMLQAQGCGLIAVIDEDAGICLNEVDYMEVQS